LVLGNRLGILAGLEKHRGTRVRPSNRRISDLFAVVAILVAMIELPAMSFGQHSDQPNVLFIAVDDLGCQLGCYGDLVAKTPNVDRLASTGVCFRRAYNQLPLCNPTRASVMTGLRPDTINVYDLDAHFRDTVPDAVTLGQAFQNAGYYSARVGKIFHYNVPASIGTEGFDDPPTWNRTVNPKGRDKTDEALVFNAEPHRKISGALSWLAADGSAEEQTDGMIATEAIKIMKEKKDEPFFLGVGFFRPHTPYVAPKRYFDMYPIEQLRLPFAPEGDREDIPTAAFAHNCPVPNYNLDEPTLLKATQAYYACVSMIDDQVGRLLNALGEMGIADNTIVVFWSDHGYHLGEHNGVWQKRTLFEQGARAPLIIRPQKNDSPSKTFASGPSDAVVEFVDIYPTITDLAGIELPKELEGRTLRPLLTDPSVEWDGYAVTQVLRPADDRLSELVMGCSIRTERFRFTEWAEGRHGSELYDHQTDPGEFNNLALNPDPQSIAVIDRLRPLLRSKASGKKPTSPVNPKRL
jgi:uncharacterized sulfatase